MPTRLISGCHITTSYYLNLWTGTLINNVLSDGPVTAESFNYPAVILKATLLFNYFAFLTFPQTCTIFSWENCSFLQFDPQIIACLCPRQWISSIAWDTNTKFNESPSLYFVHCKGESCVFDYSAKTGSKRDSRKKNRRFKTSCCSACQMVSPAEARR